MANGLAVSYGNGTKSKLENVSAAVTYEFLSRVLEERSYKPLADKMATKMLEELVCDPIDRKRVKEAAVLLQKLTEAFPDAGIENMTQQCERLDIHHANAGRKYNVTVQHLFSDGITWGRVTLFYSFSIGFALHVADRQMDELVNSVRTWSVQVMNNKVNPWIHTNGGWESFIVFANKALSGKKDEDSTHSLGGKLLTAAAVVGVAAIAGFFAVRGT